MSRSPERHYQACKVRGSIFHYKDLTEASKYFKSTLPCNPRTLIHSCDDARRRNEPPNKLHPNSDGPLGGFTYQAMIHFVSTSILANVLHVLFAIFLLLTQFTLLVRAHVLWLAVSLLL